MPRIPYEECVEKLKKPLCRYLNEADATALARIFTDNSAEGVYSHGVNRFLRALSEFEGGQINPRVTEAERVSGIGGLEIRDARSGVGPLVAENAMRRAIALAREHGIACVSVRNNSHWLRAGRYGQMAANAGMVGMCFTNTTNNMLAWGGKEPRTGNNPLCIAVPFSRGNIVMDMAASQFSYGKLEVMLSQGRMLPVDGGYDEDGKLSRDPAAILKSRRMLPVGCWKGSALSVVTDMMVSALSLGRTTKRVADGPFFEQDVSQAFIAIHYAALVDLNEVDARLAEAIDYLTSVEPVDPRSPVRYPGQNIASIRADNLQNGIPVDDALWQKILERNA